MIHSTLTRTFRGLSMLTAPVTLGVFATVLLLAPAALAGGEAEEAGKVETMTRRIELPTLSTTTYLPYTIEVPTTWELRREIPAAGIWIGPPGAQPDTDPEMVFVRQSDVDLSDPEAVVASIETAASDRPWDAPQVEVFEAGGRRGVWVLMEIPGDGTKPARRTLTVKMPVEDGSVDVMATAPVERFESFQPTFERVLRSIRPAAEGEPDETEEGGRE